MAEPHTTRRPRSMARMLRSALILLGVLTVALRAIRAALFFHNAFRAPVARDRARTAAAVAAGYESSGTPAPEDLARYDLGSLRLTLIAPDGGVLFDSLTDDPAALPNHLDRPEVQQALAGGAGQSVRHSETAGMETHYYALLLADGTVLRLADETSNVWSSYNRVLPLLLLSCQLIVILGAVLAAVITRQLVRPVTRMAGHRDSIEAVGG